jgi:hypothetical protein
VIIWIAAVIVCVFLLRVQWAMGRARQRIDGLHKAYFTDDELQKIGLTDTERNTLASQTHLQQSIRGWEFLIVLLAVILGGTLLVSFAA